MASIKVAVRVRPFSQREIEMPNKPIIQMNGQKTSIINTKISQNATEGDLGRERVKEFTFDHSYWSFDSEDVNYASQETVFNDLGQEVVDNAFEGYNACVFAYGQTGSGKTFTMMGTPDSEGLIPRICQDLFGRMKANSHSITTFRTEVSYLEIYNERAKDLLRKNSKESNLRVREHPKFGPYVEGLSQHIVLDYSDVLELMTKGNSQRTTASTAMNDVSSRSHAIFTLIFTQAKFISDMPSETVSKVNLVDLAGSERADTSGATGQRLKEGCHINKSLVTLGTVISALAELSSTTKKQGFIPYRDSVLTWLLKDSLGGNSKTMMIATVSPAECNYGESLSTLRYANRAKSIINRPTINEDQNVKLIRELRAEIAHLRSLLADSRMNNSPRVMEKLQENEARVKFLTEEWTEKWRDIQKILKEQGTLGLRKSGAGVILDSDKPHLIGIDDDLLSTGITLYHLKEGTTLVGTASATVKQDIELSGAGIAHEHCIIELRNGIVTLIPLDNGDCSVNNVVASQPTRLYQGCIILLGETNMFRFNNPAEVERLKKEKGKGSTLNLSRLSLLSRSVSDLGKSVENLNSSGYEANGKELEFLEAKRRHIELLEVQHREAEDKRRQEQEDFEKSMEEKRQQLEDLRQETEKTLEKVLAEEERLKRKSIDIERQFQQYLAEMHCKEDLDVSENIHDKSGDKLDGTGNEFENSNASANGNVAEEEKSESFYQFLSQNVAEALTGIQEECRCLESQEANIRLELQELYRMKASEEDPNLRSGAEERIQELSYQMETLLSNHEKLREREKDVMSKFLNIFNQVKDEKLDQDVRNTLIKSLQQKDFLSLEKSRDAESNRMMELALSPILAPKPIDLFPRSPLSDSDSCEFHRRLQELKNLELHFEKIQEELDERRLNFERENLRELNAIELEKFRLEELQQQNRIRSLVEHELREKHLQEERHLYRHSTCDFDCYSSITDTILPVTKSRSYSALPGVRTLDRKFSTLSCEENNPDMPGPYRITIPSFTLRGSGSTAHYEYEVKIWAGCDQWTIFRRYKRFRELHQYMKVKYSMKMPLPFFPPRKIFGSRSEKVVQERRKHLEKYLQYLVVNCSKVDGSSVSPCNKVSKQNLYDLAPFFQKGCFETSKHGTG